jgi:hypothetical protein
MFGWRFATNSLFGVELITPAAHQVPTGTAIARFGSVPFSAITHLLDVHI